MARAPRLGLALALLLCVGGLGSAQESGSALEYNPNAPELPRIEFVGGDYPHLNIDGRPIHLHGWDLGANLRAPSAELRGQVALAQEINAATIVIRVDLASLAGERDQREWGRLIEMVNAATNAGRWFLFGLEMDLAPEWYIRSGSASVMEATTANDRDDRQLGLTGPDDLGGQLRIPGQGGYISFGDGEYLTHCSQVIEDIYYQFRNERRFLGWMLTTPSSPMFYPGMGREGVAGISDYSPATRSRFNPELHYWDLLAEQERKTITPDVLVNAGPFLGTSPFLDIDAALAPVPEPAFVGPPLPEAPRPPGLRESGALPEDPSALDELTPEWPPERLPSRDPARPAEGTGDVPAVVVPIQGSAPEPYPPLSNNSPDRRPLWVQWNHFRLYEQLSALDRVGQRLRALDAQRPIFATAWGALAYREQNGYRTLGWCADPVWLARRTYIDGLIIPFALSSQTFGLPSGIDDSDNIHALRAMTHLARRYNKIPLVAIERHPQRPPRPDDVEALQQWCVAAGVDQVWSRNGFFTDTLGWSREERQWIARGAPYQYLPFPDRGYDPSMTLLDSPLLLSNAYADKSPRLSLAANVPDMLTACGVDFTVIFPQEFPERGGTRAPLGSVTYLVQGDLITEYDRLTAGFQQARATSGATHKPKEFQEVKIKTWLESGLASVPYRFNTKKELLNYGAPSRLRNGPPTLLELNDTYVFYTTLQSGVAPELMLLERHDPQTANQANITYYNFRDATTTTFDLNNGYADFFKAPDSPGAGPVLMGRPDKLGQSAELFTRAQRHVLQSQRLARMRAQLPWIVLLAVASVALGMLFLYQVNISRRGGFQAYLRQRRLAQAQQRSGKKPKPPHRFEVRSNSGRVPGPLPLSGYEDLFEKRDSGR